MIPGLSGISRPALILITGACLWQEGICRPWVPGTANAAAPDSAEFPAFVPRLLQDSVTEMQFFLETISPADIDGDGDLDFYSGQGRSRKEFWFENRGRGIWNHHVVSDSNDADVGAAVADVDGDGDMDRLAGGFLYLNPGQGKSGPFVTLRTGAPQFTHDLYTGDIDKDGRPDFAMIDHSGIHWFRNPGPPYSDWPATEVTGLDSAVQHHGGLGLGDFDGDGDLDLSRVNCWFENADGGRTWKRRDGPDFGLENHGSWGISARALAEDIDGDGDIDLIQAESDMKNGRVAWFENRNKGAVWIPHIVKDSVDGQDFHSMVLADFDGDGDKDFFSCGSEGNPGPKNWYVWENLDGRAGSFREHVIWKDAPRDGHESVAMDMDGDGDLDILSKEFSGFHLWMENLRITDGAGLVAGPGKPTQSKHPRLWWGGSGTMLLQPQGSPANVRDGLGRTRGSYPLRIPPESGK